MPRRRRGGDEELFGVPPSPPIHGGHWKWLIIWYMFLGGLSAGCYVVAAIADAFGSRDDRVAARVGRHLAAIIVVPCPFLLILDLGRPERFLNMFRVIKLRSPMSLGTWGLSVYGGFAALSATIDGGRAGLLGRPGRLIGRLPHAAIALVGSSSGFFVGGYTGVLLGATAVPVWAKNARLLGPLFLSSSLAAACGLISLVVAFLPGRRSGTLERLHRAERCALAIHAATEVALSLNSGHLGRPLHSGRLGQIHLVGSIGAGVLGPIVVHDAGRRLGLPQRLTSVVGGMLSVAGALALKYVVVMAGHESASDPAATFELAGGRMPAPPIRGER